MVKKYKSYKKIKRSFRKKNKRVTGYSLKRSVLGRTSTCNIELTYPLFLNGGTAQNTAITSSPYAALYSYTPGNATAVTPNMSLLAGIGTSVMTTQGSSAEYVRMSNNFTHCRVKGVSVRYIRGYVNDSNLRNAGPFAINVVGLLPTTSTNLSIYNSTWQSDNSMKVMAPLNTPSKSKYFKFPNRSFNDINGKSVNDWVPVTDLFGRLIYGLLGMPSTDVGATGYLNNQSLLVASGTNSMIGTIYFKVHVEFSGPQSNSYGVS